MAKNYKRPGETIDFTAAADTPSGKLVLVGGVAGVSLKDVANGAIGTANCEGVWELPKGGSTTSGAGTDAYITPGGLITGTASGNTRVGRFWEAATNGPITALVKLNVP